VLDVGVAVPDVGEYAAIDPAWGIGDPREQLLSALAGMRAAGRLPVHGHDLRPSFASYASNDAAGKVDAARELAASGPIAILGGRDFSDGARWLAVNTPIPVIDVNALPSAALTAAGPSLFKLRTAQDVLYRAAVRWADSNGWLTGRRIGVFSDRLTEQSAAAACDELSGLGHDVRSWIRSDGTGVGSDADESAVTTFADVGVEVVFPFVGGSSWIATLRHAAEAGYRPSHSGIWAGFVAPVATIPAQFEGRRAATTVIKRWPRTTGLARRRRRRSVASCSAPGTSTSSSTDRSRTAVPARP
jgi:hypothetical protein